MGCRIIWILWETSLPHRCIFLVGDDQNLFVRGHSWLVDEAGPKVVAGEGEIDGWTHATAYDAAHKRRAIADLRGGHGREW